MKIEKILALKDQLKERELLENQQGEGLLLKKITITSVARGSEKIVRRVIWQLQILLFPPQDALLFYKTVFGSWLILVDPNVGHYGFI